MKLRHVLLMSIALGAVGGCVHKSRQPALGFAEAASSLTIYDAAQNVLADERIPVRGWTPLAIVLREGSYEGSEGIFVKINGNVRFVPWLDLIADPLGQRFYSDAFVKAGELTLRVIKAPCGGRNPLTFQVQELRSTAKQALPETVRAPTTIGYEPISTWTDSGIYLPDPLADRIDSHWDDQECQSASAPTSAAVKQQVLIEPADVRPASSGRVIVLRSAPKPDVEKEPVPAWGKPCRRCRKDERDDYDRDNKW